MINEHSSVEEVKEYELNLLASLNEAAYEIWTVANSLVEQEPLLIPLQEETDETILKADKLFGSVEEMKEYELNLLESLNEAAYEMWTIANSLVEQKPLLIRLQEKTDETILKADKLIGSIIATEGAVQRMHEDVKIIHSRVIAIENGLNSINMKAHKELGDDNLEVGKISPV
jgi:hypothetical protein